MRSREIVSSSFVVVPATAAWARTSSVSTTMVQARCMLWRSFHDFKITTGASRLRLHDRLQVPEHDVGGAVAVDGVEARAAAVILDEGRRALVVFGQAPGHRRLLVVLPLDEERAVLVAEGVVLGRVVVDVVRGLAMGAPAAAGQP